MIITAQSARRSAYLFNWGNILTALIPVPFVALWFGASILIYTFNRNHPEKKVLYYTQRAANRFYLVAGTVIVLGKFIPRDETTVSWFLLLWACSALVIIIPSLRDISDIWHDNWKDLDTEALARAKEAEESQKE